MMFVEIIFNVPRDNLYCYNIMSASDCTPGINRWRLITSTQQDRVFDFEYIKFHTKHGMKIVKPLPSKIDMIYVNTSTGMLTLK